MPNGNDNTTDIKYELTRANIEAIRDCRDRVTNLLDDVTKSVNRATQDDAFVGEASETEVSRFTQFRSHFEDFIALINKFALKIEETANQTAETESKLNQQAEELNV